MSPVSSKVGSANEFVKTSAIKSSDKDGAANVRKAFRSFTSALIVAARQAENVVTAGGTKMSPVNTTPGTKTTGGKSTKDPLEEAVGMVLKQRVALRRTATLLEGKLRGNAKESEALQCCLRSQPCVGGRKRQFALINSRDNGDNGKES